MNDWATFHIDRLQKGETIIIRPRGNSMLPLIKSKERVTLIPIPDWKELKIGDIVLCRVVGRSYLHKITAIKNYKETRVYQISNNKGYINGWTTHDKVFGLKIPNAPKSLKTLPS